MSIRVVSVSALVVAVGMLTACPPKPAEQPLPPPGLAGAPTAVDPNATMPAGHPPIDGAHAMNGSAGGDDGAPLSTKPGQLPLPNLPGMQGGAGGAGGAPMGAAGAAQGIVFSGKVLEKLDVPSYTYLRVQTSGGEEWVAVSTMPVNVGDTVTVNQQMVMENFPSKALGRTFPRLVMGTAVAGS
jgi:hypothetical protein